MSIYELLQDDQATWKNLYVNSINLNNTTGSGLSWYQSQHFTGAATGPLSSSVAPFHAYITRIGDSVMFNASDGGFNTTDRFLPITVQPALPTGARPFTQVDIPVNILNNGSFTVGECIISTAGVVTISAAASQGFTGSGSALWRGVNTNYRAA